MGCRHLEKQRLGVCSNEDSGSVNGVRKCAEVGIRAEYVESFC
jgi:hypothetical protein